MNIPPDYGQQIHPDLKENAQEIEESEVGTLVIGANYFDINCYLIEMDIRVQEPKKINILEEFVLKAIHQFKPAPTPLELSQVLGFDVLFIDDAIKNLLSVDIVQYDRANNLVFTDPGLQYYKDGFYPKNTVNSGIQFIYVAPLLSLIWIPKVPDGLITNFEKKGIPRKDPAFGNIALGQTIDSLVENGSGIHSPEIGHRVIAIEDIRLQGVGKLSYPAYLLLDKSRFSRMEDDNLTVRLFSPIKNQRDFQLEGKFADLLRDLKIEIEDVFPSAFESAEKDSIDIQAIEPQPEYKQAILAQYKQEEDGKQNDVSKQAAIQPEKGTIEFLYAGEIRLRWLETLRETKHLATLISPWITDEVVDREMIADFKKLAQRDVIINIGWGIETTIEKEKKPIPTSLSNKLNLITTPDGLPAVNVFWLGEHHNKDFIVDRRIHISGSHNYLSYRGDRHPRGESAYYIINQGTVQKALSIFDGIFDKSITRLWDEFARTSNQERLIRCCVAWTCIYRPDKALIQIHNHILDKRISTDSEAIGNLFKGVFKSLIHLPQDEFSKGLIPKIIKKIGMYDPVAVLYLKQNKQYIQEWVDCLFMVPESRKSIMEYKKFLGMLDVFIPDKT